MKATTEIRNPRYRSRRALSLEKGVVECSLAALLSGCANSPLNTSSGAGTGFQRAKRDFYSTNPLGRYYQNAAFNQVMSVLNSNTDAQVAAQLNSLRGDYGDISGFFASLTAQRKQQLWKAVPPHRFNAILAKMTLEERNVWCAYYIALGMDKLVPITTDGTT